MTELVVPDERQAHPHLDADRLERTREMVGRAVFRVKDSLAAARSLARDLSTETGAPVLVNDVTAQNDDTRTVDVYMHQDGREVSVSEDVERPRRE